MAGARYDMVSQRSVCLQTGERSQESHRQARPSDAAANLCSHVLFGLCVRRLLLPEGAGAEALLAERYDAQQGQQRLPSEGQLQAASSKGGSDSKAPDGDLGLFDALLEGDAASEAQVWECLGEGRGF